MYCTCTCRNQKKNWVVQHPSFQINQTFALRKTKKMKLKANFSTSHVIIKPKQRNSVQSHVSSTSSVLTKKKGTSHPFSQLLKCNFQNIFAFQVPTIHTQYWNCLQKLEDILDYSLVYPLSRFLALWKS